MRWLEIEICGLKRKLPVVTMGPKLSVASVSLLGDVELVNAAAAQLVLKLENIKPDILVGPETKVVPLLHKMSELMNLHRYVVCRKGIQAYMISPVVVSPGTFRNKRVREMAIDGQDAINLKGKKVVIVDDVVFTGGSFWMVKELLEKVGAKYCGLAAIFQQGDKFEGKVECLYKLPVFDA